MTQAPGQEPTVSVAVLNHRRPALLGRVLGAIAQLEYPALEIVVVGDQPALKDYALPDWLGSQVRYVHFAEPNICKARNLAIRAAGGEIIAFIDDDAVPEPTWLSRLVEPFRDTKVATAAGLVRASDGVSIEWQGGTFDQTGQERAVLLDDDMVVQTGAEQTGAATYLSVRGVNSAFRRQALVQAGGFDEAIRYYLDETDMALRLAKAGWSAAIVRHAEVHHLLVPNASRGVRRMPGNQREIGASKAVFCAKHAGADTTGILDQFRHRRLAMLDPQMRLGLVRMADRNRVSAQLDAGILDGQKRIPCQPLSADDTPPAFQAFQPNPETGGLHIAIDTGWSGSVNRALRAFAHQLVAARHRVSLFSFTSGPAALSVSYRDGMWMHRGGTWAWPSNEGGELAISRAARARSERARISATRSFDVIIGGTAAASETHIELPGCGPKIRMVRGDQDKQDPGALAPLLQSVADATEFADNMDGRSIGATPTPSFPASAPVT